MERKEQCFKKSQQRVIYNFFMALSALSQKFKMKCKYLISRCQRKMIDERDCQSTHYICIYTSAILLARCHPLQIKKQHEIL